MIQIRLFDEGEETDEAARANLDRTNDVVRTMFDMGHPEICYQSTGEGLEIHAVIRMDLPGVCAGPHGPNVFRESGDAIAAILALHFPTGTILDVNYGLGAFYRDCPSRAITGVDLKPTGHVVADNKQLPFQADSFDVGVCDPPYKRGDGWKYEARYGIAPKTETKVTWSYFAALLELLRVCRHGVIIKIQDGTDGHRFHPRHIEISTWMESHTGLQPHDIAVIVRHTMANSMVQGQPHFFQQGVSYFLIYRWREKNPFRPVRF